MKRPPTRALLILAALLLIAAAGAVFALTRARPQPAADPAAAWDVCRQAVLGELPAPSTAAFAPFTPSSVSADSAERYRVQMRVEAEDFGGHLVQISALCRLNWDGATLELTDLQMR